VRAVLEPLVVLVLPPAGAAGFLGNPASAPLPTSHPPALPCSALLCPARPALPCSALPCSWRRVRRTSAPTSRQAAS
jgi:hypothetical protein